MERSFRSLRQGAGGAGQWLGHRLVRWAPRPVLPVLVLGTVFFIVSLAPSLVPRDPLVQVALSGLSLTAGVAIGLMVDALWRRLQLPRLADEARRRARLATGAACALAAALALWQASEWQDSLRRLMGMPPVETVQPFTVAAGAVALFVVLFGLGRLVRWGTAGMSRRLARVLPGPQATLVAVAITAALFWNIGNGVLVRGALTLADGIYSALDERFEEGSPRPTDPMKAGAPGSALSWEGLGRQGRAMIADGPDRAAIEAATGAPALEPLRVYVGLNSAPDPEARAALALEELVRIGAFERGTLVIATPTGTGWIDPAGQQALEYVLRGDVATVAVQYSYLASWIALLADPGYGVETARAVFAEVYGHWRDLPADARPALYLNGLSLGALNSDLSHDLHQVVGDPFDGALWVGPPFGSPTWGEVTRNRNPGSPAWLPDYRDGSAVRFMNQTGLRSEATAPWGAFRILYLQHASDAVTFFDPRAAWRRPAWMVGPRGPDVAEEFRWLPVVTFLQLGIDIMPAVDPPVGFGHSYAFESYVEAWVWLMEPPGWTPEALEALKAGAGPGD